jgi:mxaD protein
MPPRAGDPLAWSMRPPLQRGKLRADLCVRFGRSGSRDAQIAPRCGIHPLEGSSLMKRFQTIALLALVALPGLGMAAAPVLKVSKSVVIHATPDAVWDKAKDFGALNTWHPAVAKDEIVAGTDNQPGAERQLTLGDGGKVHEKLLSFNDKGHQFAYAIVDGVLPVSSYTSHFKIIAVGKDSAKVTWSGTFKRKDIGPTPADDANDATATKVIGGVYQTGLDNLKKVVETK